MPEDWEDGDLDIQLGAVRAAKQSEHDGQETLRVEALFPETPGLRLIYVLSTVWTRLWTYALDNKDREVGGVLLGEATTEEGRSRLKITGFLEGRYMEERFSSLTFTHRTWNDINERRSLVYPDKRVLGWFHTHPGHGVFLSRYDLFIHQNFFSGNEQVAVVFDPVHRSAGFFGWQEGRVAPCKEVYIYALDETGFDSTALEFLEEVRERNRRHASVDLAPIEIDLDIIKQDSSPESFAQVLQEELERQTGKQGETIAVTERTSPRVNISFNDSPKSEEPTESTQPVTPLAQVQSGPDDQRRGRVIGYNARGRIVERIDEAIDSTCRYTDEELEKLRIRTKQEMKRLEADLFQPPLKKPGKDNVLGRKNGNRPKGGQGYD